MRRRVKFVGGGIAALALVAVVVVGFLLSGLWNALMPDIFNLPPITFWQALGLFVLARLLFGFGGVGSRVRKSSMARGWHRLTPEQREHFRRAMGEEGPTTSS